MNATCFSWEVRYIEFGYEYTNIFKAETLKQTWMDVRYTASEVPVTVNVRGSVELDERLTELAGHDGHEEKVSRRSPISICFILRPSSNWPFEFSSILSIILLSGRSVS